MSQWGKKIPPLECSLAVTVCCFFFNEKSVLFKNCIEITQNVTHMIQNGPRINNFHAFYHLKVIQIAENNFKKCNFEIKPKSLLQIL